MTRETLREEWRVEYRAPQSIEPYEAAAGEYRRTLAPVWVQAYEVVCGIANIQQFDTGTFTFVYDFAEDRCWNLSDQQRQSRVVVAFGFSNPGSDSRDDYRLKGWLGRTVQRFGQGIDKGHFIGHSLGGRVDRCEINVYAQTRDLNRGWSAAGRRYVAMERYRTSHPGVFLFNRPIYADETDTPAFVEFGVLRRDSRFWVEIFDNKPTLVLAQPRP